MNKEKPIYFKGLNGIRAIACIIVLLWHISQFSYLFNLESLDFFKTSMAVRAVDMFFVLSGFLITFLLLTEKEKFKKINVKNFYIRRIFRIWPIYYLALLIAIVFLYFGIIPKTENYTYSILLYAIMLPNLAYALGIQIKGLTPLWSVGVEEQFYVIWAFIVNKASNYSKVFLLFFIIVFCIKVVSVYTIKNSFPVVVNFLYKFKINIMMLGALGALWVKNEATILKIIYRKDVQLFAWLVFLYSCLVAPIHLRTYMDSEINSIIYLIIILNVATNTKTIISLENKVLNFLGEISYGIYVYHMLIIFLISFLFKTFLIEINYLSMFCLILTTTIFISKISYEYFEKPFLKQKKKYMMIRSVNKKVNE